MAMLIVLVMFMVLMMFMMFMMFMVIMQLIVDGNSCWRSITGRHAKSGKLKNIENYI